MSVADRLNKLSTDITNAYTSINNKGGTIPANKNTDNLHTAIDSIQSSNIIGATAEGESLNLANTKAMPYSDYVVEGKREQATRSGKNKFNKDTSVNTTGYITSYTYSNGVYTIIPTGTGNPQIRLNVSIPQGTYTLNSNNYLSVATILRNNNGLLYSFENNYENQTFTINESSSVLVFNWANPSNTNPIILDLNTLQIEQGSTATSYEPYGASPSPDYPSEIHSVADDVNLFDKEKASINSGTIKTVLDTGVRITLSSSGTFRYSGIEIGGAELLGKTITLYSTITQSSNNDGAVFLYYGNSSNMAVSAVTGGGLTNTGSKTITIANEFPTNCDRIYGLFYANRNGTGNTNDYVDYTNLKIQYGDTATPYSPYNQGTVTIKQRGKNLFDDTILNNNWITVQGTIIYAEGANSIKYKCNSGETYSLTAYYENKRDNDIFAIAFYNSNDILLERQVLTYSGTITATAPANSSYMYVGHYLNKPTTIQLEKGNPTLYEPYQTPHDYTFQTEPLRSLPNGVKDTIEAEQHRRIEYLVFDGSDDEGWELWSGGTNTIGFKISNIANLKNIQSSSTENIVLSNYFKKKTNQDRLTGDDEEGFATAVGNLYFKINRTTVNSLAEWKIWLSTHPTEIIYELATEVIEPLTQNQATTMLDIIKTGSYEGTTNIYTDEDVKPTMKVDYYKKA